MSKNSSAALIGSALLRKDWSDLKADLGHWTRAERILAGLFSGGILAAMPFLVALVQR
jgi:hypothetical protein